MVRGLQAHDHKDAIGSALKQNGSKDQFTYRSSSILIWLKSMPFHYMFTFASLSPRLIIWKSMVIHGTYMLLLSMTLSIAGEYQPCMIGSVWLSIAYHF